MLTSKLYCETYHFLEGNCPTIRLLRHYGYSSEKYCIFADVGFEPTTYFLHGNRSIQMS